MRTKWPLGAAAALALLLGSVAFALLTSRSTAEVTADIRQQLAEGDPGVSVDCPPFAFWWSGSTFTCDVTEHGAFEYAEVTVTVGRGDRFSWVRRE